MHQEIPENLPYIRMGLYPPNWVLNLMTPCHNDSNIPKNLNTVNLSTPFPFFIQESASIRQAVALRKDVSAMCSGLGKGPSKAWRESLRKNQLPNQWLIH